MAEADVVINDGPSQKRQKTLGDFFPGVALPPLQKDDPKCEFKQHWLKDDAVGTHWKYMYDENSKKVTCT